jgi:UDP-MurNAc hydroxylase
MKVTHLQSSTQVIHLGDVKVLTDPWLTSGEYYGSWYHYPPFGDENIASLAYDYIYVSHIHPDHLSTETFKRLPHKKPVLIHKYASNFVKRKLEMLDFEVIECEHAAPFEFSNGGSITIYAADDCNPELCGLFMGCAPVEKRFGTTQIDTLAVFQHENQVIINTNDCPFGLAKDTIKKNKLDQLSVDLLLVGYAGAGPFPQCFEFDDEQQKRTAATAKEKQFLTQAVEYIELLKPRAYAPFAGTYILGSRLSELTEFRGVPSIENAIASIDPELSIKSTSVLLGKLDEYDVSNRILNKSNTVYDQTYAQYVAEISQAKLEYDDDDWDDTELNELMQHAFTRFNHKAEEIGFISKTKLIIQSEKIAFELGVNSNSTAHQIDADTEISEPFVKISVDHNLLHRLLRGPRFAHWNNAEIGSHLRFVRKPDIFERGLYHCLCFLHK